MLAAEQRKIWRSTELV